MKSSHAGLIKVHTLNLKNIKNNKNIKYMSMDNRSFLGKPISSLVLV